MKLIDVFAVTVLALSLGACTKPKQVHTLRPLPPGPALSSASSSFR